MEAGRYAAPAPVHGVAYAPARLATVVRGPGGRHPGGAVGWQLLDSLAAGLAASAGPARAQPVSRSAAPLCAGNALRLSFHRLADPPGNRRLVAARIDGAVLPAHCSGVEAVIGAVPW